MTPELIDDDSSLHAFIDAVSGTPRIAVDTEFHRERTYFAQLALIQVGWSGGIGLIDPLSVDPAPLSELLGADTLVLMHAAKQDLEILERCCGGVPDRLVDTQLAAGFLGYSSPSLASLTDRELGVRLPKADRLTDWLKRPLSEKQLTYAASDVEHLVPLYELLEARLEERGRMPWLREAMGEMLNEPRGQRDPDEVWRRIKEIRHLRGKDLAVARSIAAWRERRAVEMDLTPRFVLSDLGVVGVAVGKPTTVKELRGIRGVDGRSLRAESAELLLEAVRDALSDPPPPVKQRAHKELPSDLRPALPLISAWVSQQSRDLEIEPALLATRADLEAFLRGDSDARVDMGWRRELVGAPIRSLLNGTASLAFDDGRLLLEARDSRP